MLLMEYYTVYENIHESVPSLMLYSATCREKKLSSFLPAHVAMGSGGLFSTLRGKSSRQAGLEQSLLEEYRKINVSGDCQQDSELIHQYLRTCHSLPYYG